MNPWIIVLSAALCISAALIAIRFSRRRSGDAGEKLVHSLIKRVASKDWVVFKDYMLSTDGKTTEIDHIVVNPRGVFVIETKDYGGKIYGKDTRSEWLQVIGKSKTKNKFYSPVKQNAAHVNRIKYILGNVPVFSVVVFVGNNAGRVHSKYIVKTGKLGKRLLKGKNVLSGEDIKHIGSKLEKHKSGISVAKHVHNIKEDQKKIAKNICPRCGSRLVLRMGRQGEFYGCSSYPECRFVKRGK